MLFVTQTKNKFVMLKVLKELSGKGAVLDLHSDSVQRKLNRLHVRHKCSLQTTHQSCSAVQLKHYHAEAVITTCGKVIAF